MATLLHHLPQQSAARTPDAVALQLRDATLSYQELSTAINNFSIALMNLGMMPRDRVAIYLPKQFETVIALFGTSQAGCTFVPVNPVLKPQQVEHVLHDCNARVLVTSKARLSTLANDLANVLDECANLQHIVVVDDGQASEDIASIRNERFNIVDWQQLPTTQRPCHVAIDSDMAAILYTSGSTGKPKGVVLSHRNLVTGANSVSQYLENTSSDRLLAVLPLSFDYGLSQLTTAFTVGASVVLIDHLFARDIVRAVVSAKITGLAAVPPLWSQLAELQWPKTQSLRYFTNSGGAMPSSVLQKLRKALPNAKPYLMYGLTEAFRSTYLSPNDIDRKPGSMGKAIPNAEILVVRSDGSPCEPNEPGELIHCGPLVAMGYWNAPEATALRFKSAPNDPNEIAVWSGDTVRRDEEGFLFFIGRSDEQIKTSGYRVSPTEIEETLLASGLVSEAVVFGIPHDALGQSIVVLAVSQTEQASTKLLEYCREQLPTYMVPQSIEIRDTLPRNPNGKYDRKLLASEYIHLHQQSSDSSFPRTRESS